MVFRVILRLNGEYKSTLYRSTTVESAYKRYHKLLEEGQLKFGIDPETKLKIKQYEELGLKPAQMLIQLRKETNKIPTQLQLNNYLHALVKSI